MSGGGGGGAGERALQDALKWSLAQQQGGGAGAGAGSGGGSAEDREFLYAALQQASRGQEAELSRALALLRVLPGEGGTLTEDLGQGELEEAQEEALENLIDIVGEPDFAVGLLQKGGGEVLLSASESPAQDAGIRALALTAVGTCAQNCPEAQALLAECRLLERLLALLDRKEAEPASLSAQVLFALGSFVRGNRVATGELVRHGGGLRGLAGLPGQTRELLKPVVDARARARAFRLAAYLVEHAPGEAAAAVATGAVTDAALALECEHSGVVDAALAFLSKLAARVAADPVISEALIPLREVLAGLEARRSQTGDDTDEVRGILGILE